ncbi:hypothetical protein JC525_09010 [Alteromonas sp. IB21]|uniref:hypothetical protein n=1 Tax=Alteromonas sp. IB21 TaxID=2779369 RepID=UPI0018E7BCC1|nr:hypothetical protein [Alteromonas sp. IB21]MBJ2129075.1 hypothetical protein [Alteromonas sp. IB21]
MSNDKKGRDLSDDEFWRRLEKRAAKLHQEGGLKYDEEKETKKIMEETGMSFYQAREMVRDAAPHNQEYKHRKPEGMSWGTYWKCY